MFESEGERVGFFRSWQEYCVIAPSHNRHAGIVAQTALLPLVSTFCLIHIAVLSCSSTLKYHRLKITVKGYLSFDFTGLSFDIYGSCIYVWLDILRSVKEERNIPHT